MGLNLSSVSELIKLKAVIQPEFILKKRRKKMKRVPIFRKIIDMSLPNKIFLGMIIGLAIGFASPSFGGSLKPVGDIFLQLLRMAVVPLIFANVVYGITQMGDAKTLGRAGGKLILYYMTTTFIAAFIGAVVGLIVSPGVSLKLGDVAATTAAAPMTFWNTLQSFIPSNAIKALADGNLLQTIVFAIFTGIAILLLEKQLQTRLSNMFYAISQAMLKVVMIVMKFALPGLRENSD
jgi:Na+/H+-dicarboxylate symporter